MIQLGIRVREIARENYMVSADNATLSQLPFVIEKIDGKHTLCGCSRVDYLDCEHYMKQPWDASQLR